LRDALVREALTIIEAEGFASFNLRALTGRLGVSQPAIYRHFASREELLEEVMVAGWLDFDRTAVERAGDDDPYGRLFRLGLGYVAYGAGHPGWFRLTFGRRDALAALARRSDLASVGQHLCLAALARVVPPDDPAFGPTYRSWWGLAHGLTFLTIERVFMLVDDDEARVNVAGDSIAAWVEGLRALRGPPGPPTDLGFLELFEHLRPRPQPER
jgi:AcrR family transcriptional regulator